MQDAGCRMQDPFSTSSFLCSVESIPGRKEWVGGAVGRPH